MKISRFLLPLIVVACSKSAPGPGPVPPGPVPPKQIPPCELADAPAPEFTGARQLVIDHTLIGAVAADPQKWPASVYARAGNSACSSTIIGDRVLLSAGHCMANGATVTFSAGANQYTARCQHHPEYRGNSTADWALCVIDRPVTGVPFERLATKFEIRTGDTVRLTGYGCIRAGGGGGNDGIFRIGNAQVTSIPSGRNYDVATRGGAALCFGDSGGAAYLEYSDGSREIFGVNSRGNIRNESYLPAVASSTMQSFAADFASRNNVKICGTNQDAAGCRDGKKSEPPSADFAIRTAVACVRGKLNPGYEGKKELVTSSLTKVLDSLQ